MANKKQQKQQKPKFSAVWIYVPLLFMIGYMYFFGANGGDPVKKEWFEIKEQMIPQGDVEKITFVSNEKMAEVTIKKDSLSKYKNMFGGKTPKYGPHFYFKVSGNFEPEQQFEQARAALPEDKRFSVEVEERTNYLGKAMDWLLFPLILLALWFFFLRNMSKNVGGGSGGGGIFNVGKSQAKLFDKDNNTKVTFKDVAGLEEAKIEVMEIVDFLRNPAKYTALGGKIPKGALLVGPPGTGKTLLAKAVAGEANVPFFSISGSDFVEMFVGVGASRVRDLFEQAKKSMPCIVFIDEIDAVGRQRGAGLGGGNDEREQTLNQLLVQMDGFESNDSIIIMAATNRADILDPALMRPGRFDRQIYVNVPDVKGREEIMKVHARNKPIGGDINFKSVARLTAGFTGADIENMLNEAAILAARDDRKIITMHDISEAINKVIAGPAKKSRVITETDKRITAYHESGHAIVAKMVKNCDNVHEVSIIPRGQAAGYTITLPSNDDNHMTKQKLLDEIAMLLAGRAAEEIVIKDISTGASNDIQRASKIARKMVTEWGMSDDIGTMYLGASEEVFLGRDYQTQLNYSDEVAAKIDEEVKRILDEQYQIALQILKDNRRVMDDMVKLLYEKETIFEDEIDKLFDDPATPEIEMPVNPKKADEE